MSEAVSLQCHCGKFEGVAKNISGTRGTRLVCYCDDCQAFANKLARPADTLDEFGGTDIAQITQDKFEITKGRENLRCLRLTEKGLYRWYTGCCQTPVGNLKSQKIPLLSLIHNIVQPDNLQEAMGPIRYRIHGKYAKPGDKPFHISRNIPLLLKGRVLLRLGWALLTGKSQPSEFLTKSGQPVVKPDIGEPATTG